MSGSFSDDIIFVDFAWLKVSVDNLHKWYNFVNITICRLRDYAMLEELFCSRERVSVVGDIGTANFY